MTAFGRERIEELRRALDRALARRGGRDRLLRWCDRSPGDVDWALVVANRNFLFHQYDEFNRELTGLTLSRDLLE